MAKKDKSEKPAEVETKKAKKGKGEKAPEVKAKKSKKGSAPEADDDLDDLDPTGPSDSVKIADLVGEHLLVIPTGLKKEMKTSAGVSDAIVADIVVLNLKKPEKSEVHTDALIFQSVLVGNLKERVGVSRLAAKLVKGEAAQGKSAPYLFEKSPEAVTAAKAWIKANEPEL